MPAEPPTVSQENRPPAIGGALALEASFGSNNRYEGIVLNYAAMANRMSRFWMASRGTTLSRGAFSYGAVGQNRSPSLGGRAGSGCAGEEGDLGRFEPPCYLDEE